MSRSFYILLDDNELDEAVDRYGLKNVGYEIKRAFMSDLKRKRNHEAVKKAQRDARLQQLNAGN